MMIILSVILVASCTVAGEEPIAVNTPMVLATDTLVTAVTATAIEEPTTTTTTLPAATADPPTPVPLAATAVIVQPTNISYIIALSDVNIRNGPGTGYNIVGWVAAGQISQVTGVNNDNSWWRVICPDNTVGSCWVTALSRYTQPTTPPITQPVPPTPTALAVLPTDVGYVQALRDLNIRSGPGTGYGVVGWVAEGQIARVTGVNTDSSWWRVICPDDTVGSCWLTANPQYAQPTSPPSTSCQDAASFVADVTVPDNSLFASNTGFVKTWRVRNNGTCTWDSRYSLVHVGGDRLGAITASFPLPTTVAPGQTVDLNLSLVAPATAGNYQSDWHLSNPVGTRFGLGRNNTALWVKIIVQQPQSGATASISGWIFSDFCEIVGSEGGVGNPVGDCVPDGNSYRANGVYNAGEMGIAGVTVQLLGGHCPSSAPEVATAVTDAQGRYRFNNLTLGNYCVTIAPTHPANVTVLLPGRFTMPALDLGYFNFTLIDPQQTPFADFGWDYQLK